MNNIRLVFLLNNLSVFFALLIAVIAILALIYLIGYAKEYQGKYSLTQLYSLSIIFPLAMIGVALAANTFTFMFFWELMSIASYFLVIYDNQNRESIKAGLVYFISTHLSAAFLMLAFLLLAQVHGGDMSFESFAQGLPAGVSVLVQTMIFSCFVIGAAFKMGAVPVHQWLPLAHPAAPSHVSAMMSGLMVKLPIYLLIRVAFEFLYPDLGFAYVLIAIGLLSALYGIAKAAIATDIKKLLAYSTVENVGICLVALGLSVAFKAYGQANLSSIALMACLFHVLNHAIFKANLFFGAGVVAQASHSRDLNKLGGLMARMPYAASFFLISTLAAAGMPFFNGFISEWMLYSLVIRGMEAHTPFMFFIFPVLMMLLAMVAGIAFMSFARLYSVAFLGYPRSSQAEAPEPVSFLQNLVTMLLALACVTLGLAPGLMDGVWRNIFLSMKIPYAHYGFSLDMGIWGFLIASVVLILLNCFTRTTVRRSMPWACGQPALNHTMQYGAAAFSQPLVRLMKWFYSFHVSDRLITFYKWFCNSCVKLRTRIHASNLRLYLLYILIMLVGGLCYAKYA